MERPENEQWKSREVARLLALVESERRYWQEIVSTLPVSLAILNQSRYVVSANRTFRAAYGVLKQDLRTRRIEDVFPGQPGLFDLMGVMFEDPLLRESRSIQFHHLGRPLRVTALLHRDWDEDTAFGLVLAVEDLSGMAPATWTAPAESDHPASAMAIAEEPAVEPPPEAQHEVEHPALAVEPAVAAEPGVAVEPAPPVSTPPPLPSAPAPPLLPAAAPVVVWTLNRETQHFTYLSESAGSMLGLAGGSGAAAAWDWLDRIAEPDRELVANHYRHILRRAAPDSIYSCEFRPAGMLGRWFRETVRVEPDALQGVMIDITERRTLESHYVQSQRVEALTLVAGRIAHDLNNPSMIIGGYGEEILESFSHADRRRNDMQQMLDATDRITELTASLQTFSRKHVAGDNVGLIDLRKELETAVERMRQVGDDLTVDFTPLPEPLHVRADARSLQALLFELAAVISDTPKVHVAIRARALAIRDAAFSGSPHLAPGVGAVILIENRGLAVANQKRTPLFESPFPGKDSKNNEGSVLARAFRHVESWDGSLWVSPDQRTVRLLLRGEEAAPPIEKMPQMPQTPEMPQVPQMPDVQQVPATQDAKAAPEPVLVPPPPAPALAPKVLVVDDEQGIRSLMLKILLREGYDVLEAGSGAEALELVRQQNIDLLLTDVVMPGMNGRELAEQVLTLRPEVRILYVSGFTEETAVESGNYPPGSMLLQKPFTLGSLIRKVKEILSD